MHNVRPRKRKPITCSRRETTRDTFEKPLAISVIMLTLIFFSNSSDSSNYKNRRCSGMIVDWPCQWGSPVPGQVYHLDVGLDTDYDIHGGYTYSQLLQIWRAANATRSHVIMQWWQPESFSGEFDGTDFEFTKVVLPDTTQICLENRAGSGNQCNNDFTERVGSPLADCGDPFKVLHSLASKTLYTQAKSNTVPEAIHSPSHAALRNYRLTAMQLKEIFALWTTLKNPRDAMCNWAADNMDYINRLIPRTYPRMPASKKKTDSFVYATTVLGALVAGLVIVTMFMVQKWQNKESIKNAQVDFLRMMLTGSLLIATGAAVMGAPSTNTSCIVEVWAINLGYTLELVPLVGKVAAVNHVINSGKKMRRVQLRRKALFGVIISISIFVAIFLIAWTAIDAPQVTPEYELTDELDSNNETVVWVLDVCSSKSPIWLYVSVGWNGLILVCTSVQAIRMRKVQVEGFNETPTLALLVYSHMMFVILRLVTYVLSSSLSEYTLTRCRSLIFSFDTLATITIYFVPKFLAKDRIIGRSARNMQSRVESVSNVIYESSSVRQKRGSSWFTTLDESITDNVHPRFPDKKEQQSEKLEKENELLLDEIRKLKECLKANQVTGHQN
mmetsp:Transcript_58482/g.68287  ORF Transcript_58482/g.68287 Transcript_58482/m.68287 type:complete len:614 (-) Transcript_58482:116-1957(-)